MTKRGHAKALNLQAYTLSIEMPWRSISQTIRARDDKHATETAAEMVAATCTEISGLDDYRARLQRSDGSNVFVAVPLSALVEER